MTQIARQSRRVWAILSLAVKRFFRIEGAQRAGAFAFDAFFALFPLIILLVTIASSFVDRDRAVNQIIAYLQSYVPISGAMQGQIFETVAGVIQVRQQAGVVAIPLLVWVALKIFSTLICATNRAWGTVVYNWWRLPLRSLLLLGITVDAVLLGMAAPVLMKMAKVRLSPGHDFQSWVIVLGTFFIPMVVVFLGLSLFYRLAPRRPTRFAEVWVAALCATVLLRAVQSLFEVYLKHFASLNAVYGAFGGIMALLMWIYLSGCVFIFGACLCASQAETLEPPADKASSAR